MPIMRLADSAENCREIQAPITPQTKQLNSRGRRGRSGGSTPREVSKLRIREIVSTTARLVIRKRSVRRAMEWGNAGWLVES
jgi:hypothetical protein